MSKPTIREVLDDVYSDADGIHEVATLDLAERVEAVLKLHHAVKQKHGGPDYCAACVLPYPKIELWPCPTIRALDGER